MAELERQHALEEAAMLDAEDASDIKEEEEGADGAAPSGDDGQQKKEEQEEEAEADDDVVLQGEADDIDEHMASRPDEDQVDGMEGEEGVGMREVHVEQPETEAEPEPDQRVVCPDAVDDPLVAEGEQVQDPVPVAAAAPVVHEPVLPGVDPAAEQHQRQQAATVSAFSSTLGPLLVHQIAQQLRELVSWQQATLRTLEDGVAAVITRAVAVGLSVLESDTLDPAVEDVEMTEGHAKELAKRYALAVHEGV